MTLERPPVATVGPRVDRKQGLDLGGSSAQSVILMPIVITLTVLQLHYVERRVQYQ